MIKNSVILIIILVSTVFSSFSQKNDTIRENYIGFNFSGTYFTTMTDANFTYQGLNENNDTIIGPSEFYRYSYAGGLSYKSFTEKLVGINLELNYIKKGGYNEFHNDINENTNDSNIVMFQHDLEYIEFPFMMNLRLGWDKLKLNFYVGPHIAWLFRQNLTILEETYGLQYKEAADFNFEFGVNGGGGISYLIGNHHMLEVDFRYSHGLTNIFEFATINSAVFNQNQVLSARIYYYYRF